MTLADLQHGMEVRYRLGRAGPNNVVWQEWDTSTLYLRRREKVLKRSNYPNVGDITELVIEGTGWASYTQSDYCGNGVFSAEDYYLEIEGMDNL